MTLRGPNFVGLCWNPSHSGQTRRNAVSNTPDWLSYRAAVLQIDCLTDRLSYRAAVLQIGCLTDRLSCRSAVLQSGCLTERLSYRSAVLQIGCLAERLSYRSAVLQIDCLTDRLSYRSVVFPRKILHENRLDRENYRVLDQKSGSVILGTFIYMVVIFTPVVEPLHNLSPSARPTPHPTHTQL